jgi:hypothetical protein
MSVDMLGCRNRKIIELTGFSSTASAPLSTAKQNRNMAAFAMRLPSLTKGREVSPSTFCALRQLHSDGPKPKEEQSGATHNSPPTLSLMTRLSICSQPAKVQALSWPCRTS